MNIVVTGASRGIGYEITKKIISTNNYSVFAIARNADNLNKLKEECLKINVNAKVIPIVCDLYKENEIEKLADEIKKHTQEINVLINNAGALVNKPFETITSIDLHYLLKVNFLSPFHLLQLIIPLMGKQTKSHVVNIGSMGGFQGSAKFAGLSAYSSSKAAMACLTECLAQEYKNKNISFNCLALGAAQTEMLEEAFPGYKAPLSAAEMADFIAYFSLHAHHFMNGKIIPVSLSTP